MLKGNYLSGGFADASVTIGPSVDRFRGWAEAVFDGLSPKLSTMFVSVSTFGAHLRTYLLQRTADAELG